MTSLSHPETETQNEAATSGSVELPKVRPVHSVTELEDSWQVLIELPGVAKSDIQLRTEHHQLVLEGSSQSAPATWQAIRAERTPVTFTLRLQFPANVPLQQAQAKAENGVLNIRVPKPVEAQAVAITID